ncbi:hypothetical protein RO3G_05563 [Rhizopus delemar RA 99-880]|uniref:Uncharacterized protein n=1 Tax=Rhizopus delemar (strain RA 99-880 / ATCC MYA-4621 / FGSC 9543 / NRRL 43880) TaxID=246409 RepID=I1BXC8_RHIO9|nr:hypothetical protein RO3G_05563 [Rhizopus delemar RA 99-880]|eukprot:EIE80858.1 hypothetical protein RO3G_05563 [Rhizopus delemar RA 99-880]
MTSLPVRPVNVSNGAPIRPAVQGQPPRPMRPPMPAGPNSPMVPGPNSPMVAGQRPFPPTMNARPPMMPHPQRPLTSPQPMMRPSVAASPPRPMMPPVQPQNNLISPMQNMHLQQQPTSYNKPRRVYAVNPEASGIATPQAPPKEPWPNSLQPQLQTVRPSHASAAAGIGYTNAPYTHSEQPLPPELRPPSQPRPRIDPDQMPAPVTVRELDEELFADKFFGNCNPRFMRSTVDRVPFSKDLADKSKLPLGLVIQPLAKLRSDEVDIQAVDHGSEGPVRCTRCRAYINPWCVFTHGGARFECNLCLYSNEVPSWYFANVDMSGRRIDANERPELRYGSVEFEVPKEYYSTRQPVPLNYVFALDVSVLAIQTGMLQAVCEGLKAALYDEQGNAKLNNRIGIITFDKDVQFFNLHASLSTAQMLVVSDIEDMFVPLQAGFLADPNESKNVILELLNSLPHMFKDTIRPESVYTSAVRGGLQALKETGGQVFVFQTCLPNHGPDMLKPRDDKSLYGTEKERNLLTAQSEKYKQLGEECVKNGVCVNTWVFPSQYMDLATIRTVSHLTGGDLRYYPAFKLDNKHSIAYQLNHDIHRQTGYDGVLRIRCSDGLQVMDHYGACHMSTYTDVDMTGIDQDKAIAAVMKHDGKLDLNRGVSFQCALLYTTRDGHRRVRVHNLQLAVTSQISDVFRYGDVDATVSVMLRQTIFDLFHKNRKELHTKLTDACVDILTAYRNNCASSTSPGQLILPEAFKLLPVYVHGAIRSTVLRGVGVDMNIDARIAGMSMFNTLSVAELVWTLYPRMFALHNLTAEDGSVNGKGEIKLPSMVRTSYERLETNGAYLVDTGSTLFVWLGSKVPPEFLQNVFGVSHLDQIDPNMIALPALNTDLSHKIHNIMRQLQSQRAHYLKPCIVRQEKDAIEFLFSTWMSEDRNAEVQTYVDYMCVLHRKIQEEMKKLNN